MDILPQQIDSFPNLYAEAIQRHLASNAAEALQISGVSSSAAIASLLTQENYSSWGNRPNLVIFATEEELRKFKSWVSFYNPQTHLHILPSFDVSPYIGILPSPSLSAQRIGWLTNAQVANRGIFAASLQALQQKTLPAEVVADNLIEIVQGQQIEDNFAKRLEDIGYRNVRLVEDIGTFSSRGDILDIYPASSQRPVRIELFADEVESLRFFEPESQRSLDITSKVLIGPASESFFSFDQREEILARIKDFNDQFPSKGFDEISRIFAKGHSPAGIEFYQPLLNNNLSLAFEHFLSDFNLWIYDPLSVSRSFDSSIRDLKDDYATLEESSSLLPPEKLFSLTDPEKLFESLKPVVFAPLEMDQAGQTKRKNLRVPVQLIKPKKIDGKTQPPTRELLAQRLGEFLENDISVVLSVASEAQKAVIISLLQDIAIGFQEVAEYERVWPSLDAKTQVFLTTAGPPEDVVFLEERIALLRADTYAKRKRTPQKQNDAKDFQQKASALSFGDLKPGDLVVHTEHGVGVYKGLEVMDVAGAGSEFIRIEYKDKDKLFIPVYRVHQIQKYSGPKSERLLDKLGGQSWQNTKVKVRSKLRDIASELLSIYVKRSQSKRPAFSEGGEDFDRFERLFPFEETQDQGKAIDQVLGDMTSEKPMDRLICGDVGFGKTEVAMRAAYKAVQDGRQVAVLAPTTVLTYQHYENFKKRFQHEAAKISVLNRFVDRKTVKESVSQLKAGAIDIVVGTHRLLSKDIEFKNLGLLIIDEEQKFGVLHKERIRKIKTGVDTLAMSATPIPRTLNMSLMGVRDLSLITTPPVDRLPTRTFVCKRNLGTIRKAIESEVQRGGQSFFLHNRVQSIYSVYDELKEACPNVRFAVGHGQMSENDLEKVVVDFFEHKIDVLICTTIIESGIDLPKANTIFIDKAQNFGLSQLYQLRGRVGRARQRAYCYLLLPETGGIDKEAQERLKIIQENTALGSGIKIAHYDLELRGSGNMLGDEQSGHVNAVGYELYLELFEEALREARGEPSKDVLEPEINVRIPAFIPDQYIQDIRTRLSYYKTLSQVESIDEIDRVEDELRDLFGKLPPQTINLLGLMLLRLVCKSLAIRDLSSGQTSISLAFTDKTPLPAQKVVELTLQSNKKYSFAPDSRLKIRMKEITWQKIYEELRILEGFI